MPKFSVFSFESNSWLTNWNWEPQKTGPYLRKTSLGVCLVLSVHITKQAIEQGRSDTSAYSILIATMTLVTGSIPVWAHLANMYISAVGFSLIVWSRLWSRVWFPFEPVFLTCNFLRDSTRVLFDQGLWFRFAHQYGCWDKRDRDDRSVPCCIL